MANEKDKRAQPRLDEHSTIFIETISASDTHSQQEAIVICNSLEISASGVRVWVDNELESGSILQLGIELPELEQPLYVVGEVRWCSPAPEPKNGYYAGFKLLESDGTDYEIWNQLIAEMATS